jgi:hypothetical protein
MEEGRAGPRILFLSETGCPMGHGETAFWHLTQALGQEPTVALFGPGHTAYQPGMHVTQAVRLVYGDQGPDILVHDVPRGRWVVEGLDSVDIPKGVIVVDPWNGRPSLVEMIRRISLDFALLACQSDVYRLRQEIAGLETFWFPPAVNTSVFRDERKRRTVDILLYGCPDGHDPRVARLAALLACQSEFCWEQYNTPTDWEPGISPLAAGGRESSLAERLNTARIAIAPTGRAQPDALLPRHIEIAASGALLAGPIPESGRWLFADASLEFCPEDSDEAILTKLRRCLADPERLSVMTSRARQRAIDRFSVERQRADFLEIARQVHVGGRQPRPRKVKFVIGALSAQTYEQRRQACLATWAKQNGRDDVEIVFLVGNGPSSLPAREGHLLRCPCPDDYQSLPQKTRWFCLWALLNYDFEYLFKCDDDTYVDIDRLLACGASADYVGHDIAGFASGGAGYLLSRRAATAVVAQMLERTGPEDVLVQKALAQAGIGFTPDPRFYPWNDRAPAGDNDLVTSHYCGPDLMPIVHETAQAHRSHRPQCGERIPKVFHQIWLGGGPLPSKFRRFQQTWKRHHADWEFRLWNETNLFRLANQAEFDHAAQPAQKADIARYEILERFGGVYLDTDFECLRSIEPLLYELEGFAAEEDDEAIAIGILGAIPNHPLMRKVIQALPPSMAKGGNACETTGPSLFTRLARNRRDFHIFGREFFYPIHYTGTIWGPLSEAYAVHHWAHSWRP